MSLKKIFPEETHNGSTADDNVCKNATANTDPTSTAVPTSAKDPSDKSAQQAEFKRVEYDGGDVYEGYFLSGKKNGHGKYIWANGDVFDGNWVDGKRQGRFVWYFTNSKGGRYINFYEDGKWIEGGIPYDERIKTVEDICRAKGKPSGTSENLNHMNMSKIPSCDSVKSGDYSDKVKKETD